MIKAFVIAKSSNNKLFNEHCRPGTLIVKGKTTAVFQKAVVELTPICKMIIKVVQQALGQQENRLMGQKKSKTMLT